MKGVKYNLKFKISTNDFLVKEDLNMKELKEEIKKNMLDIYGMDVKTTSQTIYNLHSRPVNVNRMLRNFCFVERIRK